MALQDPLQLVGTIVSDKYEIERVVGEGGFAIVYRARHTVWNRAVAIKVFRALGDLPSDRRVQLVEGFIQEGRLLAELSERSAAICQARDIGMLAMADGREMPFMVLEWLEGRSLEQVLEQEKAQRLQPRTAEEALRLLEPAAEALALAHRKGIAHRDVKPANIFVLGDPRGEFTVKLLDFGIAKVVQDAQRLAGSFAQTQGGVSSFTPAYGAPEQFSRSYGATGPWTDVFAFALIFTELMTYEAPLQGEDIAQLAFSSMDPRRRPTPRAFGAAVPDAVEAVLRRALAIAPNERFQTMAELWEALRSALSMDPSRVLASMESLRVGSSPELTALAPSSSGLPSASASASTSQPRFHSSPSYPNLPGAFTTGPAGITGPPMPPGNTGNTGNMGATGPSGMVVPSGTGTMPAAGTLGAVGSPTTPGGASTSTTTLFVAGGLGVAAFVGLAVLGVWFFALRGRDGVAANGQPVASVASASSAPVAPPPPTCPEGMTLIPGGKFFMGSDDRKDEEHERPAHQVVLSPYCMDTTEVTVAQYKACSDRGECKRAPTENDWEGIDDAAHKLYDPLCNIREPEARANHPINCIDWELANAYCKAVGKRLPTEAEWEFATRGSDGRRYPWGDEPPTSGGFLNACGTECVAWGKKHPDPDNPLFAMYQSDDGFPTTAPAGSFPKGASPFGLQDVVGNVWEWVGDWYAPYGPETLTNPTGPATGTERVIRGGAWNGSDPAWVRPTFRFKSDPKLRSHGIGVRCAKSLETPPDGGAP